MARPKSVKNFTIYGVSIQYMRRYIKRGRTPHVVAVQEALRDLMVGEIMSSLDIPKEEREKLDGITRWYFGRWEWTRDGEKFIVFRE